MLGEAARLADLHEQFDYRAMPTVDAVRIGLLEEVIHSVGGRDRTLRRPVRPLAPRSIQMLCRALAQISTRPSSTGT